MHALFFFGKTSTDQDLEVEAWCIIIPQSSPKFSWTFSVMSWIYIIEGSLEVKLPTKWADGKADVGESERRSQEVRRAEKRKSEKTEDAGGRKVAIHCGFPMICGSGWSKSRLAKAAGAEPSGQMRDEQLHTVVARSTFRNQNVQSTSRSENFEKSRCRKIARCCGAKHISKSKA